MGFSRRLRRQWRIGGNCFRGSPAENAERLTRRFLGCLLLVGAQFGEQLPLVLFGF
jgi:hypothetical protein